MVMVMVKYKKKEDCHFYWCVPIVCTFNSFILFSFGRYQQRSVSK